MNIAGGFKVLGVLAVAAAAVLWPGKAAIAHDLRGSAPHGPSVHRDHDPDFRLRDGDAPFRHDSPRWFMPLGAVVPVLPDLYSTYWFDGIPYYYAYGNYFVWRPDDDGYMVTSPPAAKQPALAPPDRISSLTVFAYPLQGQSQSQQAKDRNECRDLAVGRAGDDPTKPTTSELDAPCQHVRLPP